MLLCRPLLRGCDCPPFSVHQFGAILSSMTESETSAALRKAQGIALKLRERCRELEASNEEKAALVDAMREAVGASQAQVVTQQEEALRWQEVAMDAQRKLVQSEEQLGALKETLRHREEELDAVALKLEDSKNHAHSMEDQVQRTKRMVQLHDRSMSSLFHSMAVDLSSLQLSSELRETAQSWLLVQRRAHKN